MSEPLEVVIVEDHLAVRKGLELLLRDDGFRIAGVASTVSEARRILANRRHDVVLVDVTLEDGSGIELVRDYLGQRPDGAVVIHTGASDPEVLDAAARSGARGFVLKASPPADLTLALNVVAAGGTAIDPTLANLLTPKSLPARLSVLSPRERQILDLLAEGLTGEDVAEKLVLSTETVRTHIRNAMTKLDAHTRVHAVALAVRAGSLGS
jgi:DNA-binding NarL/FixJ family response regulator